MQIIQIDLDTALSLGKGNPGALTFLITLNQQSEDVRKVVIPKLQAAETLRGTNLWVLFSDLCGKDFEKVKTLCAKCPTGVLENACSRQDYSGLSLVAKYLN